MIYMNPQQIVEKYGKFKGVLHVGAHLAEERNDYINANIKKRIWVEANPFLAETLLNRFQSSDDDLVINAAISEFDNEDVKLNIANNGQSSSLLPLKLHSKIYKDIFYTKSYEMKSVSLNTLLNSISNSEDFDIINLDIQGVELRALKGLGKRINQFKAIYAEVNTLELYENCDMMHDLDNFLESKNFKKVGFKMNGDHGWGDALYISENYND